MNEEIELLNKFRSFFNEVLPMFGVKDVSHADKDLSDAHNIHTIIYFLNTQSSRALIVNIKSSEEGIKKFYFHLNPKEVGNVQNGFTLIKRVDFQVSKKFKHTFHALSLEPFLVNRIDVLLFEDLLSSLRGINIEQKNGGVDEIDKMFTFGREGAIIKEEESDKYISIHEHSHAHSDQIKIEESEDEGRHIAPEPIQDIDIVPTKSKLIKGESKIRQSHNKIRYSSSSARNRSGRNSISKPGNEPTTEPQRKADNKSPSVSTPSNKDRKVTSKESGSVSTNQFKTNQTPDNSNVKWSGLNKSVSSSRSASTKHLSKSEQINVLKYEAPSQSKQISNLEVKEGSVEKRKQKHVETVSNRHIDNSSNLVSHITTERKKKKQIYVLESLDAAREGVKNAKQYVPEITIYQIPPKSTELVMQAVLYLMTSKKMNWHKIKTEMKKTSWIKDLIELSSEQVDPSMIDEVIKNYLMNDEWEKPTHGHSKPSMTKAFAEWVETFCWDTRKKFSAVSD